MRLHDRIAKLEARSSDPRSAPKRPVPEWLQECLESQGFVFGDGNRVISGPQYSGRPEMRSGPGERNETHIERESDPEITPWS